MRLVFYTIRIMLCLLFLISGFYICKSLRSSEDVTSVFLCNHSLMFWSEICLFICTNHISHLHQSYFQSNAAQSSDVSSVFLASAATAGKQPFVSIHLLTQQSQSTLLYFRITINFVILNNHNTFSYILESQ